MGSQGREEETGNFGAVLTRTLKSLQRHVMTTPGLPVNDLVCRVRNSEGYFC